MQKLSENYREKGNSVRAVFMRGMVLPAVAAGTVSSSGRVYFSVLSGQLGEENTCVVRRPCGHHTGR